MWGIIPHLCGGGLIDGVGDLEEIIPRKKGSTRCMDSCLPSMICNDLESVAARAANLFLSLRLEGGGCGTVVLLQLDLHFENHFVYKFPSILPARRVDEVAIASFLHGLR